MATRRPAIYGPEPWGERHGQVWSHWDRWYALVAVADHAGDLAGLEKALDDHPAGHLGEDAQAKLAHLDDLTVRLAAAGIDPAGLLGSDALDRTVLTKARRKVVTQSLAGRDLTDPMRHPPRRHSGGGRCEARGPPSRPAPPSPTPSWPISWRTGPISGRGRSSTSPGISRRSSPASWRRLVAIPHGCWRCDGLR
jgi:hypothetical protein